MSEYAGRELVAAAARETNVDVLHTLASLPPVLAEGLSVAEVVRALRDERDEELARRVGGS